MRVVFFGTPRFALPSLRALCHAGFEIPLAVTRPDKPVGRSGRPRPSPVAELAEALGLPVEKPGRLAGNAAFFERLAGTRPDAIAVVAYGKLLPSEILELPPLGCVNVHASLLPRHRGASPVQAAIIAGDAETGVVTMRIVPELDAGPIYLERRVVIGERDDAAKLSERLAEIGGALLVETLAGLEKGAFTARPQSGDPTFTRPIAREHARVDWTRPAPEIARRLRAFTPWPGLHTFLNGERIKLLDLQPEAGAAGGEPGTIRSEEGDARVVAGAGTSLRLLRVQREGRTPVSGAEFVRGLGSLPARFE